jgi:hypothetical protein
VFADSAILYVGSIKPLVDMALAQDDHPVLFEQYAEGNFHQNSRWTKRDTFVLMDCDTDECHTGRQVYGGLNLWKKTPANVAFAREWLKNCQDPRLITDEPNTVTQPNLPDFQDHRHDQSILSVMALKHKVPTHCDPSVINGPRDVDYLERNRNCKELLGANKVKPVLHISQPYSWSNTS